MSDDGEASGVPNAATGGGAKKDPFEKVLEECQICAKECSCVTRQVKLAEAADKVRKKMESASFPSTDKAKFEIHSPLNDCNPLAYLATERGTGKLYAIHEYRTTMHAKRPDLKRLLEQEKKLLFALDSPFILKLLYVSEEKDKLYIFTEPNIHNDLEEHFERITDFASEELIKLILAQIILGLEYLHSSLFLHTNVKMNSVLFFANGYLKLSNLARAMRTYDPEDMGVPIPSRIMRQTRLQYEKDWWAFSIIAHELLMGKRPDLKGHGNLKETFFKSNHFAEGFPKFELDEGAQHLLKHLLHKHAYKRLGLKDKGPETLMKHPWFEDIDFTEVYYQRIDMKDLLVAIKGEATVSDA